MTNCRWASSCDQLGTVADKLKIQIVIELTTWNEERQDIMTTAVIGGLRVGMFKLPKAYGSFGSLKLMALP